MESDSLTLDKSIWAAVRSFGAEISKRATVRLRTLFERADRCKPVSCAQSLGLTLCDSTFFVWRHLTAQIKNHEPFRVFLSSWAHVTWVIRYIRSTCAGLIRSTAPGDWAQLHKFLCVKLSPVSCLEQLRPWVRPARIGPYAQITLEATQSLYQISL